MKIDNYVIIVNLKSEPFCKLIIKTTKFKSFDIKFTMQALLQKHILNRSASLAIQQAFSKPCLLNTISKDSHLVFFLYFSDLKDRFL